MVEITFNWMVNYYYCFYKLIGEQLIHASKLERVFEMSAQRTIHSRKALEQIQPYSPGKPMWELQSELGLDKVIKLASNENPFGPSEEAVKAITQCASQINRYPDAQALHLKQMIAVSTDLTQEQLIITNGADELITLISETYLEAGDEIIVPAPSFREYNFGAHLMGAKVVPVALGENFTFKIDAILAAVTERTKIVYICSPNNPTGTYLSKVNLDLLLNELPPNVLIVFDAAYWHYATAEDYTNGMKYIALNYPIIVLQTFSKIYGLAGIRVGFGAARKDIIQSILKVKEPFNVNALAQVAALAAFTDDMHMIRSKMLNTKGRKQLYQGFSEMNLHYIESMSNFVLVKIGPNAEAFNHQLLQRGIIVRYGDIWGLPEYIRVSVGTAEENDMLIKEMKSIFNVNHQRV
jgi:histidinol-phosphate aminotransferase